MISNRDAEEILKHEYHLDNFTYLVKELLLPDFTNSKHAVHFNNDIFQSVTQIGESSICNLSVFEVYLNEGTQNKRVAITQEMFKILRGLRIDNALVSFVNQDKNNYRISLLTSKYEYDGDKIVRILSNPRRFSYSLGFGTKTKTPYKYLIAKGKVNSLEELTERFSVEVVNKQFYNEIALCYSKLVGGERDGKKYERQLGLYSVVDQKKYAEFAVRLIGRLTFCWFLREKKSKNGIPLIPEKYLTIDTINQQDNYYHKILEPLFFELLNTHPRKRKDKYRTEEYKQIPYLNGGLFSPHSDDLYKFDNVTQYGRYGLVNIPNQWFIEFYNVLNQYNFTVDENTSYDIELSIDPEMLGRIFENLLAEINPETGENAKKSTGSFYTPRDIVDYMVDSSLLEYLKAKTSIEETRLKALISYGKEDDNLAIFDEKEKKSIINALYTITILDPACGSGAFPIGMLQKIVYILQEIDPSADMWFDKATENFNDVFLRKEFEKKFKSGDLDYIRKLKVIQNSIFGIDIQPIAVEISRLRCFLSLIIEESVNDQEEDRGIKPLPNLDFKFIIANSLIGLENNMQRSLFENEEHIQHLKDVRDEYFNAESERRTELKLEFKDIQQDMLLNTIANYQKQATMRYQQLSAWKPFENEATNWFDPDWMFGIKDGFDIVIGNPPYIKERDSKKIFDAIIKTQWGKKWHQGKMDYWYFFAHRSFELLKPEGNLCFIASNYFPLSQGGVKLNRYIAQNTTIIKYLDFSKIKVFESADVQTMIFLLENQKTNKHGESYKFLTDKRSTIEDITVSLEDDSIVEKEIISSTENLLNSESHLIFSNSPKNDLIKKLDNFHQENLIKATQGIVENPNIVNKNNIKYLDNKDVKIGDEVFVISKNKLTNLNLNNEEKKFVREYHYPSELKKYYCISEYQYYLLYLTKENISDITQYPNIYNHLLPYKKIMEARRETANKSNCWYHLHWPRNEQIFKQEKIIYPQMCNIPIFSYSNQPYFINMSANLIYKINQKVNMKVLTVLLNSKLLSFWIQNKAKKRGVNVDISVSLINKLPINLTILNDEELITLTEILFDRVNHKQSIEDLENMILKRIYQLYKLSADEIKIVEEF